MSTPRSRRRSQERAELYAAKRGDVGKPKVAANDVKNITGLDWLLGKKRITREQFMAGEKYGKAFRIVAVDGLEPLRSCLNDTPGGGNGPMLVTQAYIDTEARWRLFRANEALGHHDDMLAACAIVCGREMTPWEAISRHGGKQVDVERMVTTLRIALDLLAKHYKAPDVVRQTAPHATA